MSLKLGKNIALPLDALTRATAIVGQRGTGKTSTAVVMVEEAARAGAQFAVVDPTGAWYGVRSSADGNGPGLEAVVFGGYHGDVPLEPQAGPFVAQLVVEQRLSVVLDLELMTKGKQLQFVAEFCETLYHLNRTAIALVVDEAHRFAPQQLRDPGGFGARCLGAVTDCVTLGRRKGLGTVLISQRPAKINKDVFEQAEIVIAHRLMGPNDRKAISGWLDEVGAPPDALTALPTLERGRAVVYAPAWPDVSRIAVIREKRTFDSSASPEIGQVAIEPKGRAAVDLAAIEEAMAETIERAKADDPKVLRARLRELQGRISDLEVHEDAAGELESAMAERSLSQSELDDLAELFGLPKDGPHGAVRDAVIALQQTSARRLLSPLVDLHGLARPLAKQAEDVLQSVEEVRALIESFESDSAAARSVPSTPKGVQSVAAPPRPAVGDRSRTNGSNGSRRAPSSLPAGGGNAVAPAGARAQAGVSNPQQKILDALASLRAIGLERPGRTQVALLAGVSPKSSGFEKNLSTLRTAGLIDYPSKGIVCATAEGAAAGHSDAPATVDELHDYVRRLIGESRWRVLDPLIRTYPDDLPREAIAEVAGVSPQSSGFEKNLSTLRSFGLIDYPERGYAVALPVLFLEG